MRLLFFGRLGLATILTLALVLTAGGTDAVGAQAKQYANSHLLAETDWLREHVGDPRVRVVDMRPSEAYLGAHIAGAVNLQLSEIISTRNRIRMYDGSWEEWGNKRALPLETGPGNPREAGGY